MKKCRQDAQQFQDISWRLNAAARTRGPQGRPWLLTGSLQEGFEAELEVPKCSDEPPEIRQHASLPSNGHFKCVSKILACFKGLVMFEIYLVIWLKCRDQEFTFGGLFKGWITQETLEAKALRSRNRRSNSLNCFFVCLSNNNDEIWLSHRKMHIKYIISLHTNS